MDEMKTDETIIIKDHFKEIYCMILCACLFFLSIVSLILLALLNVQKILFSTILVVILFFMMVLTPFILAGIFFYYVAFYGDPIQSSFKKQKFIISNEKITLNIPFYRKKKQFEIRWQDFSRIEIKRSPKERHLLKVLFPNKIFSYDINFLYPERTIRINSSFRMFHIKKIVEILDYLTQFAENKNKEIWIEMEVREFVKSQAEKLILR